MPAHFGLGRPADVTVQLYDGRLSEDRLRELAPVVFAAASGGHEGAVALVRPRAGEPAGFAHAAVRAPLQVIGRTTVHVAARGRSRVNTVFIARRLACSRSLS